MTAILIVVVLWRRKYDDGIDDEEARDSGLTESRYWVVGCV